MPLAPVLAVVLLFVVVPVDEMVPLGLVPPQRVSEVLIGDERVVEVFGNNVTYVRGKGHGVSRVVLTGVNGGRRDVMVVVPKASIKDR